MRSVYLDHTATTPLDPEVFNSMMPYFQGVYGNASSIHRFGREARAALDTSRDTIAKLLGASAGEVYFVSSGTEADNAILKGVALKMRDEGKDHIVTSKIEHHAVLESCAFLETQGFSVTYLQPDPQGTVSPDAVREALKPTTGLVSIMHANNEVGTINPIAEIAEVVHTHGAVFHSDTVQTFGKLVLDMKSIAADFLSLSAHKIYGPKGIGAMYIRKGTKVEPFMHGGAQERGRRAGTENVAFAVGFAKAATMMAQSANEETTRLSVLRGHLREQLAAKFPFVLFNGNAEHSLPHIVNISFDSTKILIDGEALLFNLDLAGIAVTSGSACTSGSIEPSHVLLALGRDALTAKASIRFSMGRSTTADDLEYAVAKLEEIVGRIGKVVR